METKIRNKDFRSLQFYMYVYRIVRCKGEWDTLRKRTQCNQSLGKWPTIKLHMKRTLYICF